MKNVIYLLVLFYAFSLFNLTGCSQQNRQTKEDVIILGTTANYPPYETYDRDGKIVGFDIDVAMALAEKLGKQLVVKDMTFDALILSLKQGKVDFIMGGISITSSRKEEVTMIPYQGEEIRELALAFWKEIPQGFESFENIQESSQSVIAVMVGTFQEEYLRKASNVQVKALDANSDLILDIQYGKSTAALFEPHIARAMKKQFPDLQLVILKLNREDWVLGNGIGVKKDNSHLIKAVDEAVFALKNEGVISELEIKWFGGCCHVE